MIFSFLGIFVIFAHFCKDKVEAYIYSILSYVSFLYIITEVYSVWKLINIWSLWITWGIVAVSLWVYIIRKKLIKKIRLDKKTSLILTGIICAVVLCGSILTVPYNWDSMVYHLGRIVQWKQNASVSHFAAVDIRELASPPMAEFINLHVYIMSGTDILLNLLQTLSYLTIGVLLYSLSNKLGNNVRWSVLAAVMFYAMPSAFLEAFTTQVDVFATLIFVSFVYICIPYLNRDVKLCFTVQDVLRTIMFALAVGIGYITKPSVCIGMVLFGLLLLCVCICRKDSFSICIKHILLAAPIICGIIIPEIAKNIKTFGRITAPGIGDRQLVGTLSKRMLLMNLYKTLSFNLPTSVIYKSNEYIYNIGISLARKLGIDINDPAISEDGMEFLVHGSNEYGCDIATSPLIAWLILITAGIFLVTIRRYRANKLKRDIIGITFLCYLIFCMCLRWEPYIGRYLISYLALGTVAIVAVADNTEQTSRLGTKVRYVIPIVAFFAITSLLNLSLYQGKIIYQQHIADDSDWAYFWDHSSVYDEYKDISDNVNQYEADEIGLNIANGLFEYPLYVMLNGADEIRRIMIDNDSTQYERADFHPELILNWAVPFDSNQEIMVYNGYDYVLKDRTDRWSIYVRE